MAGPEGVLLIIGGGRMGEALAGGLVGAGEPAGEVRIVESDAARRQSLEARFPVAGGVEEALRASSADGAPGAVIAVKPPDVPGACAELKSAGVGRVLSIAAGVTLASLEGWLGEQTAVVRAMPNTPALVGAGASAFAGGSGAGEDDLEWAAAILSSVGLALRVGEPALDAVTGLSGSGPAYLFLVAEALIDAGVAVGLTRPVASALATQTILGAGRLLIETGDDPAALRAAVTSPGGTTAAGLRALEASGVRSALIEAVVAATERSRELGRPAAG